MPAAYPDPNGNPSLLLVDPTVTAQSAITQFQNLGNAHFLTTEINGTTYNAMLQSNIAGDGTVTINSWNPTVTALVSGTVTGTVQANQGAAGTAAWPVSLSGTNNSVQAIQSGAWTVAPHVVSAAQSGAWTANVNATAAVSIAAAQSVSAAITGVQTVSVNTPVSIAPAQSVSAAITGTQTVSLTNAVSIAANQSVSARITGTQTVSVNAIAAGQSVSAAITGTQTVSIANIAAGQSVSAAITGTQTVSVGTLAANQSIAISGTPAMSISQTASLAVVKLTTNGSFTVVSNTTANLAFVGFNAAHLGMSDSPIEFMFSGLTGTNQRFLPAYMIARGGHTNFNMIGMNLTHAANASNVLIVSVHSNPSGTIAIDVYHRTFA